MSSMKKFKCRMLENKRITQMIYLEHLYHSYHKVLIKYGEINLAYCSASFKEQISDKNLHFLIFPEKLF